MSKEPCQKSVPIFPVRYSVKPRENEVDKLKTDFPVLKHSEYVLRLVRTGYIYLYDAEKKGKGLHIWEVKKNGMFQKIKAKQGSIASISKSVYDKENKYYQLEAKSTPYVLARAKAKEVYIGFSDALWTSDIFTKIMADTDNIRTNLMTKIDVDGWDKNAPAKGTFSMGANIENDKESYSNEFLEEFVEEYKDDDWGKKFEWSPYKTEKPVSQAKSLKSIMDAYPTSDVKSIGVMLYDNIGLVVDQGGIIDFQREKLENYLVKSDNAKKRIIADSIEKSYKSKFNKRVLDLYSKSQIDELTKSKYRMHEQRAKYDKNIKLDESAKEKLVSVYATQERSLVNEEARLDFIEKDDKLHDEYIENIIKSKNDRCLHLKSYFDQDKITDLGSSMLNYDMNHKVLADLRGEAFALCTRDMSSDVSKIGTITNDEHKLFDDWFKRKGNPFLDALEWALLNKTDTLGAVVDSTITSVMEKNSEENEKILEDKEKALKDKEKLLNKKNKILEKEKIAQERAKKALEDRKKYLAIEKNKIEQQTLARENLNQSILNRQSAIKNNELASEQVQKALDNVEKSKSKTEKALKNNNEKLSKIKYKQQELSQNKHESRVTKQKIKSTRTQFYNKYTTKTITRNIVVRTLSKSNKWNGAVFNNIVGMFTRLYDLESKVNPQRMMDIFNNADKELRGNYARNVKTVEMTYDEYIKIRANNQNISNNKMKMLYPLEVKKINKSGKIKDNKIVVAVYVNDAEIVDWQDKISDLKEKEQVLKNKQKKIKRELVHAEDKYQQIEKDFKRASLENDAAKTNLLLAKENQNSTQEQIHSAENSYQEANQKLKTITKDLEISQADVQKSEKAIEQANADIKDYKKRMNTLDKDIAIKNAIADKKINPWVARVEKTVSPVILLMNVYNLYNAYAAFKPSDDAITKEINEKNLLAAQYGTASVILSTLEVYMKNNHSYTQTKLINRLHVTSKLFGACGAFYDGWTQWQKGTKALGKGNIKQAIAYRTSALLLGGGGLAVSFGGAILIMGTIFLIFGILELMYADSLAFSSSHRWLNACTFGWHNKKVDKMHNYGNDFERCITDFVALFMVPKVESKWDEPSFLESFIPNNVLADKSITLTITSPYEINNDFYWGYSFSGTPKVIGLKNSSSGSKHGTTIYSSSKELNVLKITINKVHHSLEKIYLCLKWKMPYGKKEYTLHQCFIANNSDDYAKNLKSQVL